MKVPSATPIVVAALGAEVALAAPVAQDAPLAAEATHDTLVEREPENAGLERVKVVTVAPRAEEDIPCVADAFVGCVNKPSIPPKPSPTKTSTTKPSTTGPNTSTICFACIGKRDAETPAEEKALNFIKRAGIVDGSPITARSAEPGLVTAALEERVAVAEPTAAIEGRGEEDVPCVGDAFVGCINKPSVPPKPSSSKTSTTKPTTTGPNTSTICFACIGKRDEPVTTVPEKRVAAAEPTAPVDSETFTTLVTAVKRADEGAEKTRKEPALPKFT